MFTLNVSKRILIASFATFSFLSLCQCKISPPVECFVGQTSADKSNAPLVERNCSEHVDSSVNLSVVGINGTMSGNQSYEVEGLNEAAVEDCAIFARDDGVISFSCDHQRLCDKTKIRDGFYYNVKYQGASGALYCCRENLCNHRGLLNDSTQPTCNKGSQTATKQSVASGPCEKALCLTATYYDDDGFITDRVYRCSSNDACAASVNGSSCQNITRDEKTVLTCCCQGNNCNSIQAAIQPRENMQNPMVDTSHKHWMLAGGIVAAVMLAILFSLVLIISIRKYKQHRAEQLSFTYTQLTADLAEPEMDGLLDDDRMILG